MSEGPPAEPGLYLRLADDGLRSLAAARPGEGAPDAWARELDGMSRAGLLAFLTATEAAAPDSGTCSVCRRFHLARVSRQCCGCWQSEVGCSCLPAARPL